MPPRRSVATVPVLIIRPTSTALATDDMIFNHCYVTSSICTPSRAAILTGTHNHVNGVMTLNHKINNLIPQGLYYDPVFTDASGSKTEKGYATDIITDKTIDFIKNRDQSKPFFVMCHYKASHRP
ncbi:alkaline-phosphatase-like protein [Xylariaceae sp. FL0016]|nr:alkaline-phosphatase-like protein [Xylariaceae sp. FL0016]